MKRRRLAAWVIAGVSLTAAAAAAEPQVVTRPDWLERPSGEAFAEHYPKLAGMLEITGFAQISCAVTEAGRLRGCTVDKESPKAFGFGRAALAMSDAFRMKPQTVDGKAVPDGVVCIPLRFVFPATSPLPPPLPARAPATAAAQRIADKQARAVEAALEAQIAAVLADTSPEADDATRERAVQAIRASAARQAPLLREDLANLVMTEFTPEEIAALDILMASSAATLRDMPDMPQVMTEIGARLSAYVSEELRTEFCRLRQCSGTQVEADAVASAAAAPTVEVARWKTEPSAVRISVAAPAMAKVFGVSGGARLTCNARPDGVLEGCVVAAEAPAGWKYGQAAIGLARLYQLDAAPQGSARSVTVRVQFPPARLPSVEPVPAGGSPGDRAMARRLVTSQDPMGMVMSKLPSMIAVMMSELDPSARPAAEEAVRSAVPRALDRVIDDIASLIAAEYSEAELSPLVDYLSSPAGKSGAAKMAEAEASITAVVRRRQALVAADARAEFCSARDCSAPPRADDEFANPAGH